jgi:hypothetical protein
MKLYLGTKWFIQRVFFIYLALIFVLIFILVALVLQLYILI